MCGRFDTSHLTWAQIHEALLTYSTVVTAPLNIEPNDDVRPTTNQLIARLDDGGWVVEKMRWGLVPFWRSGKPLKDTEKGKGDGFKLTTFNARCEGVASAATFKGAFARRRCVVPASAWYEWTGNKGAKTKHTFRRQDGAPIWFAGIWDQAVTSDAGEVRSFTILTGKAQGWLTDYHDRAPVILEPEDFDTWMDANNDPADVMAAVKPERFEVL
ncbi:putative SOS response-associated peptidase YedK [compost metagenome]